MPDPRLTALADALIPGAAEADPTGKWTERALAARPDLGPAFERALDAVATPRPWSCIPFWPAKSASEISGPTSYVIPGPAIA